MIWVKIEVLIRNTNAKNTSVKRSLEPYVDLCSKLNMDKKVAVDIHKLVA